VVRIVDIVGLDTQADGGTHVASTAMVGRVEVPQEAFIAALSSDASSAADKAKK